MESKIKFGEEYRRSHGDAVLSLRKKLSNSSLPVQANGQTRINHVHKGDGMDSMFLEQRHSEMGKARTRTALKKWILHCIATGVEGRQKWKCNDMRSGKLLFFGSLKTARGLSEGCFAWEAAYYCAILYFMIPTRHGNGVGLIGAEILPHSCLVVRHMVASDDNCTTRFMSFLLHDRDHDLYTGDFSGTA